MESQEAIQKASDHEEIVITVFVLVPRVASSWLQLGFNVISSSFNCQLVQKQIPLKKPTGIENSTVLRDMEANMEEEIRKLSKIVRRKIINERPKK